MEMIRGRVTICMVNEITNHSGFFYKLVVGHHQLGRVGLDF